MLGNLIKAGIFFLLGYFAIIIMNEIVPPMITALELIYSGTEIEGVIWLGIIILWILFTIVYPTYLITQIEVDPNTKALNTTIAVLMSILSVIMIAKMWYWIPALAGLSDDAFITALFWIGITLQILMTTTIAPIMIILANRVNDV